MNNKKRGRPIGRHKESRLDIMISSELKKKFKKVAYDNGTNVSVKVCELITKYIRENDKGDIPNE